jgi:RNA polymerase sigma-70 factor (ECF subfamily)
MIHRRINLLISSLPKLQINQTTLDSPINKHSSSFSATRWTIVLSARGDSPEARAALSDLCAAYWQPVYQFLRREGRYDDDSRDLAQAFFLRLLERGGIDQVDPAKGHFRSYLLGALKHFLAEQRRNDRRQKRGGGAIIESIDSAGTDTSPGFQIADPSAAAPDAWFDREWALAVMDRGLQRVQADFERAGKSKQFETLKPWLIGDTENLSQSDVAAALGTTLGAVKVMVHRLRKDFREAIQAEIAQTVPRAEDIADEIRYLIEVLG